MHLCARYESAVRTVVGVGGVGGDCMICPLEWGRDSSYTDCGCCTGSRVYRHRQRGDRCDSHTVNEPKHR